MKVPNEIITKLKEERCVAFIGAGLSIGAGLPDWKNLMKQMIAWCKNYNIVLPKKRELDKLLKDEDFSTLADTLIECMGANRYHQFLKEVFRKEKLKPTEPHKLLPQIPFSSILTTNYDKLIEGSYTTAFEGEIPPNFTHLDTPELAKALQSNNFYILKTHGDIDRVDSIVLGKRQYRELLHNNNAYKIYLQQILTSKTILFLGFSLTDPDLFSILDELSVAFKDNTPPHYALMDATNITDIKIKRFRSDYNINIISYKPSAKSHPEVLEFLREVIKRTPKKFHTHLEKAKQNLENIDSHYEVIASTDGQFLFKEKYPGASEDKPLTHNFTLIFDTKTEEGKKALNDWKNFVETGEKIHIKGSNIKNVEFPPVIEKVFGEIVKNPINQEIIIGSAHSNEILKLRLVMIPNENGEKVSIENIELKKVSGGTKQAILSNEHQNHFLNYKILRNLELDENGKYEANVSLNFNFDNLNLFQLVTAEKFIAAIAKGGILRNEYTDTGNISEYPIPSQTMKPLHPFSLRTLEDLLLIEQKTNISFDLPKKFTDEETKNIFDTAYSMKTGRSQGSLTTVWDLERKAVEDLIQKEEFVSTNIYTEHFFTILGKKIPAGFIWIVFDKLFISETDRIDLITQLKEQPEKQNFTIKLFTKNEFPALSYFLEYLPPEEFEQLHEDASFRETTLNHLLAFLFGISSDKKKIDFDLLIKSFEFATKQVTNTGKPFNMLKRCTVEEFIKAIKPVLKMYNEIPIKEFLLEMNQMEIIPIDKIDFIENQLSLIED